METEGITKIYIFPNLEKEVGKKRIQVFSVCEHAEDPSSKTRFEVRTDWVENREVIREVEVFPTLLQAMRRAA